MRRSGSIVGLVVLAGAIPAWSQQVNQPPPKESIVAFQDISVIPMDTERVLPRQMVLIRNGRIVEVGSVSAVRLPPGTMLVLSGTAWLFVAHLFVGTGLFGMYAAYLGGIVAGVFLFFPDATFYLGKWISSFRQVPSMRRPV